jgi:hypothetical protein
MSRTQTNRFAIDNKATTYRWSYMDHQNLSLYFNPGLLSGQYLHITSSGVQCVSGQPACMNQQLDPPANAVPFVYEPMDSLTFRSTLYEFQSDLVACMTPKHYDCRMVMAWIFSSPLSPRLSDAAHLRFFGSNASVRKDIMKTLSKILYGHDIAVCTTNAQAIKNALTYPIVLSTDRPDIIVVDAVSSQGALLASAGTAETFQDEMERRAAYAECNPQFYRNLISRKSGRSITDWRKIVLQLQTTVLSRLLKLFEIERQRLSAKPIFVPSYTFAHETILHAIADIMETN